MKADQKQRQNIHEIIQRLRSTHADLVYVAKDYSKAELIMDLERALYA